MRVLAVALVALLLSLPVTTDAGVSVARKAAQALRIAKAADKRSRQALAAVRPAARGAVGATGPRGAVGLRGEAGLDGRDGADAATGPPVATFGAIHSAQNAGAVTVPLGERVTVVGVVLDRETAAEALVIVEGQMNGENGASDQVVCEIRQDGSAITYRTFTAPPSAEVAVTASAVLRLPAGPSTLAFTCRKTSEPSMVSFPPERTRLTVVG